MKTSSLHCALILSAIFLASSCLAQKVPVSLQAPSVTNRDRTAMRFSKSLADEIQLSDKFYLWTGKDDYFPSNGVVMTLRSAQVDLRDGAAVGSAIFVSAERPSVKDPRYFKVIAEQVSFIPKDAPVADETHGFLANVSRAMEK